MDQSALDTRKAKARTWFEKLRDDICAALEGLEDALPANAPLAAATISTAITPTPMIMCNACRPVIAK